MKVDMVDLCVNGLAAVEPVRAAVQFVLEALSGSYSAVSPEAPQANIGDDPP